VRERIAIAFLQSLLELVGVPILHAAIDTHRAFSQEICEVPSYSRGVKVRFSLKISRPIELSISDLQLCSIALVASQSFHHKKEYYD
jgi:hypothetical protein